MRIGLNTSIVGGSLINPFSPSALFANGEVGVWYDPSPETTFTDTAGTALATVGDAVARINDLSGNGHNATQATTAARPILRQDAGGLYYLEFDGVDDVLISPSAVFFGEASSMILGAESFATSGLRTIGTNASSIGFLFSTTQPYGFVNNYTVGSGGIRVTAEYPGGRVVSWLRDEPQNSASIRVDGVQRASTTHDQTDNVSRPLAIGGSTTGNFGRLNFFSLVHIARSLEANELTKTEKYVSTKTAGVDL